MDFEQFPLKKKSLQKDNYDLEKKFHVRIWGWDGGSCLLLLASFNLSLDSTINFNNMNLLDNSEGKI